MKNSAEKSRAPDLPLRSAFKTGAFAPLYYARHASSP